MARPTTPRRATWYPLIDNRPTGGRRMTTYQATTSIRSSRRQPPTTVDAVHVYATTDRVGTALHVAYIHYTPGFWSNVDDVIDVYEIPTDTLTDL
ncbi:hypothetical protein ACFWY6_40305 [Streptomyces sp. NPDC059037]|uniref:hypothetical protein n=1 Tax=Streptomyces sp. NPDC059037 TaxID=3346710 RepID=UPI0036800396